MGRVILWNLISLDGCFDGAKSWDLGWHEYIWGEEMELFSLEQLRSAQMLLFGRSTYEGMAAYWQAARGEIADLMNRLPKAVCSRTLKRAEWNNTRLLLGEAADEVAKLKRETDGNILVFGSGSLAATLTDRGLLDEYRLGMVPVVLGTGRPLFSGGKNELRLNLLEAYPMSGGCVVLRYEPHREQGSDLPE